MRHVRFPSYDTADLGSLVLGEETPLEKWFAMTSSIDAEVSVVVDEVAGERTAATLLASDCHCVLVEIILIHGWVPTEATHDSSREIRIRIVREQVLLYKRRTFGFNAHSSNRTPREQVGYHFCGSSDRQEPNLALLAKFVPRNGWSGLVSHFSSDIAAEKLVALEDGLRLVIHGESNFIPLKDIFCKGGSAIRGTLNAGNSVLGEKVAGAIQRRAVFAGNTNAILQELIVGYFSRLTVTANGKRDFVATELVFSNGPFRSSQDFDTFLLILEGIASQGPTTVVLQLHAAAHILEKQVSME
jgi:hypothetical protein